MRSEVNTGGSGGFRAGVELALEEGDRLLGLADGRRRGARARRPRGASCPLGVATDPATAVVCTAVAHLMGGSTGSTAARSAASCSRSGEEAYAPGTNADVDCASFVGLCIRSSIAREIGPVKAEFFLGYDDAEWSLRARRHGRIRLVPEAQIVHKIVIGGGEQTRRARFANRLLGQEY